MAKVLRLKPELAARLERLKEVGPVAPVTMPIETFAPEPYRVRRAIPIVVRSSGDGFVASFVDANISSSGDTQQEAYANVKELILDVFDRLNSLPAQKLGPGPARQLEVLREFVDAETDHKAAR
jgi:predicted RNase H-like HicB family nuclease